MKLTLCNEVLAPMNLKEQCAFTAALGYDGLEIAPFTLAEDPTALSQRDIADARAIVEDHGLVVSSLHWLAMAPKGLSITALDSPTQQRTRDALLRIVDLAAGLGAKTLVHGSPAQRRFDDDPVRQRAIAIAHFAALGAHAGACGLTYCIEAINRTECNFINRLEQAEAIIEEAGAPALKLMLDVSHAAQEESEPLAALAERYWTNGRLAHVQLNAINRQGPGQSDDPAARDDIAPLMARLSAIRYSGAVAMEPFVYVPDGPGCAARAIGYVRGVLEAERVPGTP
ncbi:sugar phosphate isomerase/epimerase family protein [Pelagibacterium xiamenense]|uniref:sugar phosphate isomerase/epimerase family protein n=1 Tax=Pelagibacterium xiamenense TaxID=2901140 RepID=UPI001E4E7215|nr:sugar phosphate isomerase/epimerase family protein [Pelagibacterium xiamenense]MCD7059157.1 sugar phosphate isomerase/epimerase [Pelagibacterium xiamenense]